MIRFHFLNEKNKNLKFILKITVIVHYMHIYIQIIYIYTISSLSIHLWLDIYVAYMSWLLQTSLIRLAALRTLPRRFQIAESSQALTCSRPFRHLLSSSQHVKYELQLLTSSIRSRPVNYSRRFNFLRD